MLQICNKHQTAKMSDKIIKFIIDDLPYAQLWSSSDAQYFFLFCLNENLIILFARNLRYVHYAE